MGDLAGRTVLVTGAAGGVGAATAKLFHQEGARVAGVDLTCSPDVELMIRADLADPAAALRAAADAADGLGPIEIVVHAAGICPFGSIVEAEPDDYMRTYAVNVMAAAVLLKACAPAMRARGRGAFVMLSSINARFATPTLAAYAASKAALESLVRTAALEFAPDGVRVNAIAPASLDTPMLRASFDRTEDAAAARSANVARHPLGRLGAAEDAAQLALFLASDRSSWVTGAVVPLDGGAGVTRR